MTWTRTLDRRGLAAGAVLAALVSGGCGIGNAQTQLRTAIDARKPSLDQCYGSTLERDEKAAGDMRLWVHVDKSSGAVQQVEVIESALGDPALEQCVQTTLGEIRMDPKPRRKLKVEYLLRFAPRSS